MAEISIYLFNRDLRVEDNELLYMASRESKTVYPVFIFTPEQVTENNYLNARAIRFMARSLLKLSKKCPISFFYGDTAGVISNLIKSHGITALYNNMDVTPYAIQRSHKLSGVCEQNKVRFIQGKDVFFGRHCSLLKKDDTVYLKFTPFYNNAIKILSKETVAKKPVLTSFSKLPNENGLKCLQNIVEQKDDTIGLAVFKPGRSGAVAAIRKFIQSKVNYENSRDALSANATMHISAYLHFGIIGPNEVVAALKGNHNSVAITKQLVWREFFLYIIWKQHVDYTKVSHTIPKNMRIQWHTSPAEYIAWCNGQTGCPIVDAGMRELNATGFMQNRARMIVAMYLIYYLKLDWKLGEMYFARNLVDYDYCNNLGGWMWCAGWEVYSNDWFRPFSMSSQTERFDPNAEYVKKWIPELKPAEARDLYNWNASCILKYPAIGYTNPIISDLSDARKSGIEMYKTVHH